MLEINNIYCGNSLEILDEIDAETIDIIITSPPYNLEREYSGYNDKQEWDKYFSYLNSIWKKCKDVLKPGGRLIVNVQPVFSEYVPTHHIISNQLRELGLLWKGEIIWEKNTYNCKYTSWGSWKSPSSPYLKYTWEFVEIFCKDSRKKEGLKENIDITSDEFKNSVYARWSIAPEKNMKDFDHPAMFPEKLVEKLLLLFSYKNDLVLDPFNGVGTTTVVAKRMYRNYIGIDLSEKYCNTAKNRLNGVMPFLF